MREEPDDPEELKGARPDPRAALAALLGADDAADGTEARSNDRCCCCC